MIRRAGVAAVLLGSGRGPHGHARMDELFRAVEHCVGIGACALNVSVHDLLHEQQVQLVDPADDRFFGLVLDIEQSLLQDLERFERFLGKRIPRACGDIFVKLLVCPKRRNIVLVFGRRTVSSGQLADILPLSIGGKPRRARDDQLLQHTADLDLEIKILQLQWSDFYAAARDDINQHV